jgi:hypothetical protein
MRRTQAGAGFCGVARRIPLAPALSIGTILRQIPWILLGTVLVLLFLFLILILILLGIRVLCPN